MKENTPASNAAGLNKAAPVIVGCLVLIISFFLPWLYFLGSPIAGFEIQKIWLVGRFLWLVPITALITIWVACKGKPADKLGQLTGVLVFCFFAFAFFKFGADTFRVLALGGWVAVISAIFLISIAPRLMKHTETSSHESKQ